MSTLTLKYCVLAATPDFLKPWWERLEASPIGYRLANGAFWSLAGTLLARGFALAASLFVARTLGRTGFGELGIIQNTVGMLATFAGLALGFTGTRYIAEFRSSDPARAGRVHDLINTVTWTSSLTATALLVVLAPWIANRFLAAPHLTTELRISAVYLLFVAANSTQTGLLGGFEAFRSIAGISLVTGLLTLPLMVLGASLGGVAGALWALAIIAGTTWWLNHRAVKKACARYNIPYAQTRGWSEKSILWSFGLPACLGSILVVPVMWFANTILVQQPHGYGEMGLFNAAAQWRNVILFLPAAIAAPLLAILSHHKHGSAQTQDNALVATQNALVLIILPAAVLLIVASSWLLRLYGPGFVEGRQAFIYVVAATAVSAIGSPAGTALSARDKMWVGFGLNLSWALLFIGLACFFVPQSLAAGLGRALLIANCALAAGGYLYMRRSLPARMIWNAFGSLAVLVAVAIYYTH